MFEVVETTKQQLRWRSDVTRANCSLDSLIEQVGYYLYCAREYGLQGHLIRAGKPRGFNKLPFLVERRILVPMVVPVGDDRPFDPYEITSIADLEAALNELKDFRAANPTETTKTSRTV